MEGTRARSPAAAARSMREPRQKLFVHRAFRAPRIVVPPSYVWSMSQASAPPVESPMLAGMAAVATALTEMVGATCWSLTDAEVAGLLDQISTAEARLTAVKLAAVSEADGRGLGRADGGERHGGVAAAPPARAPDDRDPHR